MRCPCCRRRRILASRGVVFCACGQLRLDLSLEGGSLEYVQQSLASAWEQHAQCGCREEPRFEQRAAAMPGSPASAQSLWATCAACNLLLVVV